MCTPRLWAAGTGGGGEGGNDLVVVTGCSSNHHQALLCFLHRIAQSCSDGQDCRTYQLLVYDLGLTAVERHELSERLTSLPVTSQLRTFNFGEFPSFFNISLNSGQYAWKPVILGRVASEFNVPVLWLDSGIAVKRGALAKSLLYLKHTGFLTSKTGGNVRKWVHPGTLSYFGLDMLQKGNLPMCNGAIVGFDPMKLFAKEMLDDWVQCALVKECIAPTGSSRANHRQDQAALTLVAHIHHRQECSLSWSAFGFDLHQNDAEAQNGSACSSRGVSGHSDAVQKFPKIVREVNLSNIVPASGVSATLADIKRCDVKPLVCNGIKVPKLYFSASDDCDWTVDLGSCPRETLNWTDLCRRRYFLLGNSVTRHYAFALKDLLAGRQTRLSREQQKSTCHGVLGTSSCKFQVATRTGTTTQVQFYWKNYIGLTNSHDDGSRDICGRQASTEACLKNLFRHASSEDVLIIGSVPSNTSYFKEINGNSMKPFHESAPKWLQSQMHLTGFEVLDMLTRAFPGPTIWHSYPHLNMKLNQHTALSLAFGDLNKCFAYGNSLMKCATQANSRVAFVNLQPLQTKRVSEYSDLIHHAGMLSEDIVSSMLGILGQTFFDRQQPSLGTRVPCSNTSRTLIFALKQRARNMPRTKRGNFWGLGDMLRGMVRSCQFAQKHAYDDFFIDTRHHPISQVLNSHRHGCEEFVDTCIEQLEFTSLRTFATKVKANHTRAVCILTNGDLHGPPPNSYCAEKIRRAFSFPLLPSRTHDTVVHIRMGDNEMIGTQPDRGKANGVLHKLRGVPRTALVISDSQYVRSQARAMGFLVSNSTPAHFGLAEKPDELDGIWKDFFALVSAQKIYAYSVHSWGSGFVSWAHLLGHSKILPLMSHGRESM